MIHVRSSLLAWLVASTELALVLGGCLRTGAGRQPQSDQRSRIEISR